MNTKHPTLPVEKPDNQQIHELSAIFSAPEADLALLKEYDLVKVILETSQAIVLILDKDARIVFFNEFLAQLSGYKLDEVKGKEWFPLFLPPAGRSTIRSVFQTILENQTQHIMVNPILLRSGQEKIIEWHNKILRDHDGAVCGVFAFGKDITEQVTTKRLLELQRDLAYSVNNMPSLKKGLPQVFRILQDQTKEIDDCAIALLATPPKKSVCFTSREFPLASNDTAFRFFERLCASTPKLQDKPYYINFKASRENDQDWERTGFLGVGILPIRHENKTLGIFFIASQHYTSLPKNLRSMLELTCTHLGSVLSMLKNREQLHQEKEKYLRIFDSSSDAVLLLDETKIVDCNAAAVKMFRLSGKEEMMAFSILNYSPPLQPNGRSSEDLAQQRTQDAFARGYRRFIWMHCRKNGEAFPAEIQLIPFLTCDKKFIQSNIRDISSQIKNQDNLQKSMDIQASLYELISLSLEKTSLEEFLNSAAAQFLSLPWMEKIINSAIFITDPEQTRLHLNASKELSEEQQKQLHTLALADFTARHTDFLSLPVFACQSQNILDVIQTQGDQSVWICPLQDSKKHLRGIIILTTCRRQNFNSAAEAFFCTAEQMIINVIHRKQAEQTFQTEYTRMDYLINSIPSVVIAVNKNNTITLWNHTAQQLFAIPATEVMGTHFPDCTIPWEWSHTLRNIPNLLHRSKSLKFENIRFTRPDKTEGFLDLLITPLQGTLHQFSEFLLIGIDRPGQKSLETQLLHSQKMESIGQLAAGIAHEINTPTQYVGDNIRFLQDSFGDVFDLLEKFLATYQKYPPAMGDNDSDALAQAVQNLDFNYLLEEVPQAVLQSLEGVERVATIVKAMKGFAHPDGNRTLTASDINLGIQNTVTVSRNEWKYVAETKMDLDPDMPMVPCLPGEINQVILNIIVNAAHAIESQAGSHPEIKGKIKVTTCLNKPWAEIRISDTGGGIPKNIQGRIFDPFFTTKEVGKGTGQGLAIARAVIKDKHHGALIFVVEEGVGTTFLIQLPLEQPKEHDSVG